MSYDTTENEPANEVDNATNKDAPPLRKHGFVTKSAVITWAVILAVIAIVFWVAVSALGTKSSGKFTNTANAIGS
jgi:hypothetical protein